MSANSRFVTATHILTLLANSDEPLPSPYMAGSIGVNPVTVRKVVMALRDSGLVDTVLGSAGGAVLGRKASHINLRDVYLAVRDDSLFGTFPDSPNPDCVVGRNIHHILVGILDETERRMIAPLADVTISDLVSQVRQRETAS